MEKKEQPAEEPATAETPRLSNAEKERDRKMKNLISAVILLTGLFIGSLFVDVAQMLRKKGFSQQILKKVDVFSYEGKSWVAYSDPIIKVSVISDDTCEACDPSQPLIWFRRMLPTMLPEKIDANSDSGKALLEKNKIKSIPAFIFAQDVDKTEFFKQAGDFFEKKDNYYVLKTSQIGMEAGKYIEVPKITEQDIRLGSMDAKVNLIEFSDFQCSYCKTFQINTIQRILKDYGDKVLFVYKHLPLGFHQQALNAALASECANAQGRFEAYSQKLFSAQDDWGKSEGTQKFKAYAAQLGLKTVEFNQCLDSKKYQEKIDNDVKTANEFGISGTPALFINNQLKSGAVNYDEIKKVIDEELAK